MAIKNEWEKKKVEDIEVDESSQKIVVGASNLKYDEKIVILSGDDRVGIASIIKQDEVTIRGIDNTAYSIIVDVDHGYILIYRCYCIYRRICYYRQR